jgi:hypothetical protein
MITLRLQTAHRGKEEPLQQAGGYNHRRLADIAAQKKANR